MVCEVKDTMSEKKTDSERRDFLRWPIVVDVTMDSEHALFSHDDQAFTRDLSEGGIFIATRRPQPAGTRLRFQFTLPDSDEPIVALGEVQWVTPPQTPPSTIPFGPEPSRIPTGMGLRFLDISTEDLARIRAFFGQRR